MLGDAVEAGAVAHRQHPGDAAVVDPGLGGEEDADDDHQDEAGDRADDAADGAGQPADRAEQLRAEVLGRALGHQAERGDELHQPVELRGDDQAKRLELGGDGRPREIKDPADEAEAEDDRQQQAPAARDRQIAAEQARAAVEEDREDRAADDQQQRLGKDDDADDEQGEAEPDRGLGELAADERIAELRRTWPLDMRLGRRRAFRVAISCSGVIFRRAPSAGPRTRSAGSTRRWCRRARR